MAIGANSYGSTGGVAALTPRYAAAGGVFDGTTKPTLAQVEGFIDQVSALLNTMLARNGFVIPVTQADCKLTLAMFTNEEVAQIAEGINGSGRFGPGQKQVGRSRYQLITTDVQEFIDANAAGFENLGAGRTTSAMGEVGVSSTDGSGNDIFPIFQRAGFGNQFDNWSGS